MSLVSESMPVLPDGYAYDELLPLVEATLAAGVSVLVRGHPGVGKSTLARAVADRMGLPLVDIRLAQRDPAEIGGVYFPDRARGTLELLAPDWVRAACEQPTFVFLDEINAAVTKLHQAAAYQIVLERRVGPFAFHPGSVVLAAGNLDEDAAIVSALSSALANRFAHFTLRVDADAWLRWARTAGIDPAIVSYIGSRGESVLFGAPADGPFPSPRSWEMASHALSRSRPEHARRLIAACVGVAASEQLFAHLGLCAEVEPEAILLGGRPVDLEGRGAEPSFAHQLARAVADWIVLHGRLPDEALPNVVRFLRTPGLGSDVRFLFLRRMKAAGDLLVRLRALPEYRALAAELVGISLGLDPGYRFPS